MHGDEQAAPAASITTHAGAAPKRPETQREVVVGLCFIAVHALSLLLRCARPANLFFLPTATAA